MALPNPGMDAVPFTPLTAEFLDDMIENIESLSDGTGFENGAVTANKIDFTTFPLKVQTGSVTASYQASGTGGGFQTITFPTPFSTVPKVFLSSDFDTGNVGSQSAVAVTTTGFQLLCRHTGTGTVSKTVKWYATIE